MRADPARIRPFWILITPVACLFALQIYAFHWGVISPDTVAQWGQALSGQYDDWHPPATAWLWRHLMPFGAGTAPVLLFDCALYWTGFGLIADVLRRRGQPWAMAAVILCAATPIPFGQMGAILKDPLLAACCLTTAGLLLTSIAASPRRRPVMASLALLLLLFASATRINALFATIPLLTAFAPAGWINRPGRLIVTLALSAALLFTGSWLIDSVALRPHRSQPAFSVVNFDLAGIVAHGGGNAYPNLDYAAARRITALCYDPGQYNPTYVVAACDDNEAALFAFAAAHRLSPVSIWLHAIAQAPGAYARHRIAHLNRNWRFAVHDVPDDAVYVMTTPNSFGLDFQENIVTRIVASGASAMARSPIGRPATWIAVAVSLLIVSRRLPSRRFVIGLAGSALIYGGSYAIASVAPDMRYNLWTMLASALALVVALAELARHPHLRPTRIQAVLLTLPAILVMTVELIA